MTTQSTLKEWNLDPENLLNTGWRKVLNQIIKAAAASVIASWKLAPEQAS